MRQRASAMRGLAALLAVPLLGGCVSISEYRKLERDVRALQQRGGSSGSTGREQYADLATRIDSVQSDLQRLEGRVEVAEHDAQQALTEARKARKEGYASPETGSAPAAAPQTTSGTPEAPPLGAPQVAAVPAPGVPAPGGPTAAPGAEDGASQKGASAEEVQAYRAAFAAWQRNDTDACIDQFRQFLQSHPASIYADDSAYWMADCYFKKGDFKTAVLRFDDVVARYPKGNKAADALYRHGESLVRLGPGYSKAARRAFERVIEEYPDSPRAAEAKRQIEQLGGTAPTATGAAKPTDTKR